MSMIVEFGTRRMQNVACSFGSLRQNLPFSPCDVTWKAHPLREHAAPCLQLLVHKRNRPGDHISLIPKSHEDCIESTFRETTMIHDVCFPGGTLSLTFGSIGLS